MSHEALHQSTAHQPSTRLLKCASAETWPPCAFQYSTYAWGMDELQPLSKHGKNSFAGMGATIVDSLSTLWMMGLTDEFANATEWVRQDLRFPLNQACCPPTRSAYDQGVSIWQATRRFVRTKQGYRRRSPKTCPPGIRFPVIMLAAST